MSIAMLITLTACSGSNKKEKYTANFTDLFDTASTVIAYDTSRKAFDEHMAQFKQRLAEYDRLYDIYTSYDGIVNLCTVNETAKNAPVKVDKKIIDLLEYCKYVYDLSDGKTNVCLGSVLCLWHDARSNAVSNPESAVLPDMERLISASKHTDFSSLIIDSENSTVYFADEELKLDVGAIAKGFAVREMTQYAKENLWSACAISIGGNVSTYGFKNDDGKTLWNIGIENPDTSSDDYLLTVHITDLCVVTSGDYQRYFTVDSKKYCHIIDPDTLMPSEYVSGVSVICNDSALGDALSTTLFNMPIDEGVKLVENIKNVEAVWVDESYNKTFSSGFEQYLEESEVPGNNEKG